MSDKQSPKLRVDVLSLFPDVFRPFLKASIPGIAASKNIVEYHLHDIRDYSTDKHKKVDAPPYGGGPGMVLQCEPVFNAYEAVREMAPNPGRLILLTPQGRRLNQQIVRELSKTSRILLLCGRYEGFDERIRQALPVEEISIGDYVLSGGESAAMVMIDAVVRLLPGVLGDKESIEEESFSNSMLEYPHYTRPRKFRGMEVPDILLSGDHAKIKQWRRQQAEKRTENRRKDIMKKLKSEREE
jgi:tRNA (guanine37-N1)-methyltransferase